MASITLTGVAAFAALLVLQVLLWRLAGVRREMLWLAVLYLLVPTALFGALAAAGAGAPADCLMAWLLCLALGCGYVQTYPALREDTPTFRILFLLDSAGAAGLTRDQIVRAMDTRDLHASKLADLRDDGLMQVDESGRATLRPAGLALARVFRTYRGLLGLRRGLG